MGRRVDTGPMGPVMLRGPARMNRFVAVTLGAAIAASLSAADKVDFRREVRPILEGYCLKCHGAEKPKGDLSLVEQMLSRPRSGTGPEGFFTTGRYGFDMLLRRFVEAAEEL